MGEASRRLIELFDVNLGSIARPPGSNSRISVKLDGCNTSNALRSITEPEPSLRLSLAVTYTSWILRVSLTNLKSSRLDCERSIVFSCAL